ncbi:MAG TPA: DUF2079 domain-containing protein [Ktedonobacteraceae bacterium]|nr:DUF2079 domain-containing protein [Ktedonobacteraceae bacterium]
MTWRKRLAIWRNRLYLYPAPETMERTSLFWIATGLVALAALIFSVFFIYVHIGRQDAYLTTAEDLGTYDQAIWNIMHGPFIHQTICNIVSDTNCYNLSGIPRFAIHFEPILFPISLLYLFIPGPKTLLVLQTLVVAAGAFPAFWLARLRLRNDLVAVGIAVLYLMYPALQQAEIFDFHAVTMTAALLMFTLYFMYTRRTLWLFVFAILSMACKEEIPLVIAFFGLWSILFQQRWRTGLALVVLSMLWVGMTLLVYHFASPNGHPLLSSRYSYLGKGPLQILEYIIRHPRSLIEQHLLDHDHSQYIRILLAPAGYLPLLAPWVLVMAFPSMAVNLLSSDRNQYLGVFQYSAEIVPVLIFSTIEAIVLITWLIQWYMKTVSPSQAGQSARDTRAGASPALVNARSMQKLDAHPFSRWVQPVVLCLLIVFALFNVVNQDISYGALPFSRGFSWPHYSAHDTTANKLIAMIPPNASLSAQSNLVPHVSERTHMYLFPYGDTTADYIFLDVTNFTYPLGSSSFISEVKKVLLSGNYGVLAAQDGYLLLKRGLPSPGIAANSPAQSGNDVLVNLPDSFCSFSRVAPQDVQNSLQVDFTPQGNAGSDVSLLGYDVAPPSAFGIEFRYMQVTAYWEVNSTTTPPLRVMTILTNQNGKEEFSSVDFPVMSWCPTTSWQPGTIVRTVSSTLYLGNMPVGLAHVGLALLPFSVPLGTIQSETNRVPLHIVSAPPGVSLVQGTNAVNIGSFTIVP